MQKYGAEFIGTFWLVLGGCGSAVLAAGFPEVGIGWVGVSLAFGLTVLTMAFAIGHISGCHLNPAITIGLWYGGRFQASQIIPYIIAQVLGGIAAGGVLYVTLYASGNRDFVGGDVPPGAPDNAVETSSDCVLPAKQGRMLARNLAPNAINLSLASIPGSSAVDVHGNTVHTAK